jgi:hypothetical protein
MTKKPRYDVVFLSNNEMRFLSLSRAAKVKPGYLPRGAERYHSQEAVAFAAEHYKATGQVLLHDEVKHILLKRKRKLQSEKARKPEIVPSFSH